MMEHPSWRVLSYAARRVLDRLEVEHLRHGGGENGHLICTYDDFETWGIRRRAIGLAILQLVALGFLRITEQGRMAAAEFYIPSRYRVTYLRTSLDGPTDEWARVTEEEIPERLTAAERAMLARRKPPRRREQKSGGGNVVGPVAKTPLQETTDSEKANVFPGAKSPLLSISPGVRR
jgi:hypothetical protein